MPQPATTIHISTTDYSTTTLSIVTDPDDRKGAKDFLREKWLLLRAKPVF